MPNIKKTSPRNASAWDADPIQEDVSDPWTKAQAEAWRLKQKSLSLWSVTGMQVLLIAVLVYVAWVVLGDSYVVKSVAYGGVCVVLPSAMFLNGVRVSKNAAQVQNRMVRFVIWELAKILLTVLMLLMAPKMLENVHWLALLVSFVVTIKVYWLALWMQSVRGKSNFVRN